MSEEEVWLDGYYPPVMENWEQWQEAWSMGPCAEVGWVWFCGDYYTEKDARRILAEPRIDQLATAEDIGGV